jgi:hypothetical protein
MDDLSGFIEDAKSDVPAVNIHFDVEHGDLRKFEP